MTEKEPGCPSFTEALRARLIAALGIKRCKTCGHAPAPTVRESAKRVGVGMHALWRFLGGKSVNEKNLDAIVAFCEREEKKR